MMSQNHLYKLDDYCQSDLKLFADLNTDVMNSLLNARVVFGKNCLDRKSILNVEIFSRSCYLYDSGLPVWQQKRNLRS